MTATPTSNLDHTTLNPVSPSPPPHVSPSRKLPPTERDFEIYDAVHVAGLSTYSQADKWHISQTRVRQIVCRVVEWLAEVLPPQAKIAREQETHLARQIAADRFQHQYEQMTTFWNMTQSPKYAGLRIRITTAQARLGAVGSRIDGLAADAAAGLPIPAYVPPAESKAQAQSANEQPGCDDQDESDERKLDMDIRHAEFVYSFQEILRQQKSSALDRHVEDAKRVLRAAGYELDEDFDPTTCPSPPVGRGSPDPAHAPTAGLHSPNPQSEISNPQSSSPPPSEDCSQPIPPFTENNETAATPIDKNCDAPPTCDITTADTSATTQLGSSTSQPLLTPSNSQTVTVLRLQLNQHGASLSESAICNSQSAIAPPPPIETSPHPAIQ